MKKSMKTIVSIAMSAVMAMSTASALAAGASAEEQPAETPSAFHWMGPSGDENLSPIDRAHKEYQMKCNEQHPCFGIIKRYLMQKGPNLAFVLGIYYIPSPIMYEVIQKMEVDIKNGDCSYIVDGKFYSCPSADPNFGDGAEYYDQFCK